MQMDRLKRKQIILKIEDNALAANDNTDENGG